MNNLAIFVMIAAIFIAATVYLGWYGYKHTRNSDEFLLGRHKTNSILIALSYGATFLSASAIVGFGGMAAKYGLVMIWLMVLCILVGTIIAFIVFGKRTRRIGRELGAYTFADLLGKRFRSPGIRTVTSLIVLVGMPIYCAAVLLGGVNFISVTVGLDKDIALLGLSLIVALYVTYGGVVAVMYNDALQAGIMFIGMAFILVFTFWQLGGVSDSFTGLTNLWDMKVTEKPFTDLVSNGMRGWTESPEFGSNIWLTVVTTLLMGVGIGSLAQPQLAVRFMSAKDDKTLNKSMWIGALFILVILGTAFTIGPLSNLFFYQETGSAAIELFSNTDMIIPEFVNQLFANVTFGDVFISLFILALICASISTMSALLHTMGSSAGYDLWSQIKERRGEKTLTSGNMIKSLKASRISTLLMMLVVVVVAYLMPDNIIAKATTIFMGLTAAALLSTFGYGLFSKNPNATAAKISIAVGAVSWTLWAFMFNAGIADLIGMSTIVTGSWMNYVDPLVIGLPLSCVALVISVLVLSYRKKDNVVSDVQTE